MDEALLAPARIAAVRVPIGIAPKQRDLIAQPVPREMSARGVGGAAGSGFAGADPHPPAFLTAEQRDHCGDLILQWILSRDKCAQHA